MIFLENLSWLNNSDNVKTPTIFYIFIYNLISWDVEKSTYCDNYFVSEKVYSTISNVCNSLVNSLLKVKD